MWNLLQSAMTQVFRLAFHIGILNSMVGALFEISLDYSKTCVKRPLPKTPKIGL